MASTGRYPPLPVEVIYLWEMWRELHAARGAGGMSPDPLSYVEIDAYCRITGEQLEPWEARAIRAVDDAYMVSLTADANGGTGDG